MSNKVLIAYSAQGPLPAEVDAALFLHPSQHEPLARSVSACQMMSAVEERQLQSQVDCKVMAWKEIISPETLSWQGVDLASIMVLDLASMLTEWAIYSTAIYRFIREHAPAEIVVMEDAERPWVQFVVEYFMPSNARLTLASPSLKQRIRRRFASLGTRLRGLPESGMTPAGKVDTLFLLQNKFTDLANLGAVIRAHRNENSLVLATDSGSIETCVEHGFNFRTPGDFGKPNKTEEKRYCRIVGKNLLAQTLMPQWHLASGIELPFHEMFMRYFPYLPNAYLFQLHRFYHFARRALEETRPKLILLAQDVMRAGRAVCLAAKEMSIPTLCLQHGVSGAYDYGFLPIYASKFAVWGGWSKKYFVSRGGDEERMTVCGSTYLEDLVLQYKRSSKDPYPKEGYISLFTNPSGMAHHREILEALAAVRQLFPDRKFIVKLHPAESDYTYRRFIDDASGLEIWEQGSTEELIRQSAVVLVYSSGVGIEAMLARRRLLGWNFSGEPDSLGAGEYGAASYITSPQKLESALAEALDCDWEETYGEKAHQFLQEYLANFMEEPIKSIARVGEELTREQRE